MVQQPDEVGAARAELERRAEVSLANNAVRIERRGRRAVAGVARTEVRTIRLTPEEAEIWDHPGGVDGVRALLLALRIIQKKGLKSAS